ncbi:hypothetical protein HY605_00665 [Candidatus Peregrinibacteria bacterium]|nr:hypothetical protein [Candidatus Peregrinibacteria bacterium]
MKKFFSLFLLFTFSACSGTSSVEPAKVEFKKVELDGKEFFFRYPSESIVSEDSIFVAACKVKYGRDLEELDASLELNKRENEGKEYTAAYKNELLVAYKVWLPAFSYGFEVMDQESGAQGCIDIVDGMADSFSDKLGYVNDKFAFSLDLPSDYEVSYLNDGISMTKLVAASEEFDPEDPEAQLDAYKVEMVVFPFEDLEDFADLSSFIEVKYPGFSIEFVTFDKVAGYYVDEGLGVDSVRHFFAMKGDTIYEAYIKLPSYHFPKHQQEFENLLKGMEIF